MTNEIVLVPREESREVAEAKPSTHSPAKEKNLPETLSDKKLSFSPPELPVDRWVMPPPQQGYIQHNDRDCL